jgi:hypothetical protein
MKAVAELMAWLEGAEEELGDPSQAVTQIFVRYQAIRTASDDLVATFEKDALLFFPFGLDPRGVDPAAAIPLAVSTEGPKIGPSDDGFSPLSEDVLLAFGVERVCDGVWSLTPSLNMPDVMHVFVVVYDVPTPAPWERRVIG